MQRIWALIQLPVAIMMWLEVYIVSFGRKKGYNGKWTLITVYLYCLLNVIMLAAAFTEGALLPLAGLYFSCDAMVDTEKASKTEHMIQRARKLFRKT